MRRPGRPHIMEREFLRHTHSVVTAPVDRTARIVRIRAGRELRSRPPRTESRWPPFGRKRLSHKGAHYVNPKTNNHYGKHQHP